MEDNDQRLIYNVFGYAMFGILRLRSCYHSEEIQKFIHHEIVTLKSKSKILVSRLILMALFILENTGESDGIDFAKLDDIDKATILYGNKVVKLSDFANDQLPDEKLEKIYSVIDNMLG
jgi:hypothetical protein